MGYFENVELVWRVEEETWYRRVSAAIAGKLAFTSGCSIPEGFKTR
ncbi:MAG: hypothetical protein BWY80_00784 [Firmicutes bacterium ADurb.Bin456]|nr:MAG: hypothetical protein BWY80_00784 [Firmicutes bacterium ADurb.Bin456]